MTSVLQPVPTPTEPDPAAETETAAVVAPVTAPASITPAVVKRLASLVAAGDDAATVTTTAPYTGDVLATLPVSTPDDVAAAFQRARAAQARWAAVPVAQRVRVMLRLHDLVLERQDEILDLMQAENGKTRRDAFLEVSDIAITSRYYARTAPGLLAPKGRRGAIPGLTRTTEVRHPKGVVAIISPWNYPLSMAASDAIPALLAGNAVVQKPDTQTALSALWALELTREAGLPDGVWQIVVGRGRDIGSTMIDNADYVMFTGSTASGRSIARDAGERLIGASLELGGKNAMVVLDDADVPRAAKGAIAACFPSAGQLCVSMERLYVTEGVADDFIDEFVTRTGRLQLGATYDWSADVGSLTTQSQLATVSEHVNDAVDKGATVLAGGKARPDVGPLFYEPTILTDVTPEMTLYAHETFGPVVSIYRVADTDEAVERANDSEYGLNASVWTRDTRKGREVAARLHAGTVNVNEAFAAAWGSIDAPMGGMGDSGLGRRHAAEGLLKYTEPQNIAVQHLQGFDPPEWLSHETFANVMTTMLKVMKRVGLK